jgi:hypothetical protein
MKAVIRNGQDEMTVVITSIRSEPEETIKHGVENVLAFVDE